MSGTSATPKPSPSWNASNTPSSVSLSEASDDPPSPELRLAEAAERLVLKFDALIAELEKLGVWLSGGQR